MRPKSLYETLFTMSDPSITDGVHRNENFVEIIPVFSTFSNFLKKKKIYKSHFMFLFNEVAKIFLNFFFLIFLPPKT